MAPRTPVGPVLAAAANFSSDACQTTQSWVPFDGPPPSQDEDSVRQWCGDRRVRLQCTLWCERRYGSAAWAPHGVLSLRCKAVQAPITMAQLLELGGTAAAPAWPRAAAEALADLKELRLPFASLFVEHSRGARTAALEFLRHWEHAARPPPLDPIIPRSAGRRVRAPKGSLLLFAVGDWSGACAAWSDGIAKAIELGCSPSDETDELKRTPLHYAAARSLSDRRHDGVLRQLITPATLCAPDAEGATPLHFAAASGSTHCVALLVARGADTAAVDRFCFTPLHRAVGLEGAAGVVEMVSNLASPHTVTSRTVRGWTPLHVAAAAVSPRAVSALLAVGAPVHAEDASGRTPMGLVRSQITATPLALAAEQDEAVAVLRMLRGASEE